MSRDAATIRSAGSPQVQFERCSSTGNGLVMVQIDGLSERDLRTALGHGRMPFIARLIAQQSHALSSLYSGLPSSTPAVQGELFYGVRTAVPAFAFRAHTVDRLERMSDPARAPSNGCSP